MRPHCFQTRRFRTFCCAAYQTVLSANSPAMQAQTCSKNCCYARKMCENFLMSENNGGAFVRAVNGYSMSFFADIRTFSVLSLACIAKYNPFYLSEINEEKIIPAQKMSGSVSTSRIVKQPGKKHGCQQRKTFAEVLSFLFCAIFPLNLFRYMSERKRVCI